MTEKKGEDAKKKAAKELSADELDDVSGGGLTATSTSTSATGVSIGGKNYGADQLKTFDGVGMTTFDSGRDFNSADGIKDSDLLKNR